MGRLVQEQMGITNPEKVLEIMRAVLARDTSWVELYSKNIDSVELDEDARTRAIENDERLTKAAVESHSPTPVPLHCTGTETGTE